jgi:phytoene dehydrogenase-like protein
VLGWAAYRMPLPNLYLCGAGAHPGGGVTGLPGRNAAVEILRDLKPGSGWTALTARFRAARGLY